MNDKSEGLIGRLLDLLSLSTCNFLAVDYSKQLLDAHGFTQLYENDFWHLEAGGKYYVTKNNSSIFAFVVGTNPIEESGFRIIAAHTDSPCFKIKPNCEFYEEGGIVTLNVEKYGGGILYTWFDRPLSVSGRVLISSENPYEPLELHVDLEEPIATIPHLAIHFNRSVNDGNAISVQKDMRPVVGYFDEQQIQKFKSEGGIIKSLLVKHISQEEEYRNIEASDILDYELCLYPAEPASLVGMNEEFIQSARIDDLSMAFAGIEALLAEGDHPAANTRILALFDNEETGSGTKQGAASPVLRHIVERICRSFSSNPQSEYMALANSFMISADDAHGLHPNYKEKQDPTNHPVLGGGPVVKINSNCKYMTDGYGAAVFHALCVEAGVNMQYFVNHSDMLGGSTLGNISSSQLDIPGVDVGCAIWAMHSARETAAVSDHLDMIKVFRQFFK